MTPQRFMSTRLIEQRASWGEFEVSAAQGEITEIREHQRLLKEKFDAQEPVGPVVQETP